MKHYYAYKTFVREKESYALLPLCNEAVFSDGMYYTEQKFLLLLTKEVKERFQMVPQVNNFGHVIVDKDSKKERVERVKIETNYEHYLHNIDDIKWFISEHVVNAEEFISFIENQKEEVPQPEVSEPDIQEKTAVLQA